MEITPHLIARRLLALASQAQQRAREAADGGYSEGPTAVDYLASARECLSAAARVLRGPKGDDDDE